MQPDSHCIQRQVIELRVRNSARAPAVQQALASAFWERAAPELEAVFDRVGASGEVIELERLEIDLGTIRGADWEPQFRRKLVAELARRLEPLGSMRGAVAPALRADARSTRILEQFLFFLVRGRLPWWGRTVGRDWSTALLNTGHRLDWHRLRRTLLDHACTRIRLVDSVSDEFLDAAVVAWAGPSFSARVLDLLAPRELGTHAELQWRRQFWRRMVDCVLAGSITASRGAQLIVELARLHSSYESPTASQIGRARGVEGAPASPRRAFEGVELPSPWNEWRDSAAEAEFRAKPLSEERAPADPVNADSKPLVARQGNGAPRKSDASVTEGEAIYLTGVGAILLHPFLEQVFRERGLLVGRNFVDDAARHRAVHLFARLCFGDREVPEQDLVLAKLLCAVPFEEPLEPAERDDADRVVCDDLLRAVLKHWSALRSDSPDWLRANFFIRDGKLEAVDDGWRLTVERHAQDVLLARLPWGFGVIGLPWLKERIFVRWLD